jgi:hypothetical protein
MNANIPYIIPDISYTCRDSDLFVSSDNEIHSLTLLEQFSYATGIISLDDLDKKYSKLWLHDQKTKKL